MTIKNNNPEEQETNINIDYFEKKLYIYTSRKSIIQRLLIKLGEPTKKNLINNSISGASWTISFNDKKKMNTALSKTLLIGQMKQSL